jgi:hypothetical protein
MTDEKTSYSLETDVTCKVLVLAKGKDQGGPKWELAYEQPDPEHLTLRGTLAGDDLTVTLKKVDTSKMPLVSRGFHWVNEVPYNR